MMIKHARPVPGTSRPRGLSALWQRWALVRQAKRDYKGARGSAHLSLLRTALSNLKAVTRAVAGGSKLTERQLQAVVTKRNRDLTRNLSQHVVQAHLDEVPGIGAKLKDRIVRGVYQCDLTDLRLAYHLHGIGEARQREINAWIPRYERRLPELLQGDFPGKRETLESYRQPIEELKHKIGSLREQQQVLAELRARITAEIDQLSAVSWRDYFQVLGRAETTPKEALARVEAHLTGTYAEWEKTPDWFQQAMEIGDK